MNYRASIMMRELCKSKIHRARVTEANLLYTGSITLDRRLMDEAGILPYEKVQVANLTNGSRLETYAIEGPEASGVVCLNGAAARWASVGDEVLILSYALVSDEEARVFKPRILHVDEQNHIIRVETLSPHSQVIEQH